MYCVQYRIYCEVCNRSCMERNYSKHLRSQCDNNIVMKKRCFSSNIAISRNKLCCNNDDLACCISKLSLKSDVNIQTDISDKQDSSSETITISVIGTDPNILGEK